MLNQGIISISYKNLESFFKGEMPPEAMQELLESMNKRGITASEVVGFAQAMREHMIKINLPKPLLDVCGTGGSGKDRFNISTAVTLLLGEMGIPIAKHGNYGSKQANGSFNFLEALGINFPQTAEGVEDQFKSLGYCFIFARFFHPALKPLASIRQAIGERTIFNLLGPLCNPASPTHQIIGTPSREIAETVLVPAIQALGIKNALVIVGADGSDELALTGDNLIIEINNQLKSYYVCNTARWHMLKQTDYAVGSSEKNAEVFKALQALPRSEKYRHPLWNHIAINAGAALYCIGKTRSVKDGFFYFLNTRSLYNH